MIANSAAPQATATESCPRCEELRERVERLRVERDDAMNALAREREQPQIWQVLPPPIHPSGRGLAPPPPLRYRVVDFLNNKVKQNAWVHGGLKATLGGLIRIARGKAR